MTVTIPARTFARLTDRATAAVSTDPLETPALHCVHAWADGKHLLMEASDRYRVIRTRHPLDADNASLDAVIPAETLTAARRLIPDPVPVAESDYEEAWITKDDPAKDWTVSLRASDDGEHIHATIHGDTEVTVTGKVRPLDEWPGLDKLWGKTTAAATDGPTCYDPRQLAGLLGTAEDVEAAAIWASGGDRRPTVITLGDDTIALIMPVLMGSPGAPAPVPDPRDKWPGLLSDDDHAEEAQA
ncbi:hypothetical protein CWT12_12395 [Actinomyces sp. 432]|uniref:hypothetical protein n=1 Tax=Actinomyces sp. 432 TaxID=2057798 RepID=UPI0013746E8B|nr:hypothetical protein [Actinomyces sp. 432]QHO91951.1 hypothetical protein CWT12_12395 [Actinomyces sp. 432]